MPADRKSNLAVPRHNPLAAPRSSTPLNRRGGSGSVPSERPVHGVRQVRELTNDERRRFNLEIYDAIDEDDPSTIERLLEDKVSVSYATGLSTPLHAAATKNRHLVAKALLQFGMDPNPTDSQGRTPLSIALQKGHTECARVLREFGAVVSAHTRIQRVSEEEMDSLAGGMSGMSGTWAVDELARLGQTMLEVRMDGGTSMGGAGAGGGGEERKRDEPKTEEND